MSKSKRKQSPARRARTSAEHPREAAAWLPGLLQMLSVVTLAAWVFLPELPADHFLARDPVNPGRLFPMIRSHSHLSQPGVLHLFWIIEGLRVIPLGWRLLLAAIPVALCFNLVPVPGRWQRPGDVARRALSWAMPLAAGVVAVAWYAVFRVSYALNATFGDGLPLPRELDAEKRHAAEALTMDVFIALKGALPGVASSDVIAMASMLFGGLFAAAIAVYAMRVGRSTVERVALFAGLGSTASSTMFYGYVETTALETAAIAMFLASAAGLLTARGRTARRVWMAAACAAAGLSTCAHAAGITVLPALLVLIVLSGREETEPWHRSVLRPLRGWSLPLFAALTVLPYYLRVLRPFYLRNSFGNVKGGGDGIAFVPWNVDYANLPSRFVLYSMVSRWHFMDMTSVFLISAPWALPAVTLTGIALIRKRIKIPHPDLGLIAVLLVAAAASAIVPLAWNHDFSMWGDWNLSATYLFPLNALTWTLLVVVLRSLRIEGRRYAGVVMPLLLTQIYLALGLQLQLY